jgi:phosphate uptake regulator
MPVTAKLSRKFYETLGDEIANELVEWFNQVDATYRADLRELNELNFARFDAKLEQRTTELDTRIDRLESKLDAKIDRLEATLNQRIAEVRAELIKWMFLFWIGTVVPLGGLIVALR